MQAPTLRLTWSDQTVRSRPTDQTVSSQAAVKPQEPFPLAYVRGEQVKCED